MIVVYTFAVWGAFWAAACCAYAVRQARGDLRLGPSESPELEALRSELAAVRERAALLDRTLKHLMTCKGCALGLVAKAMGVAPP